MTEFKLPIGTSIDPEEVWSALKKNKRTLLIAVLLGATFACGAYWALPKKYKISTTISLPTQYFQLPLVSGFLPETYDTQELRAKRESLIRRALNYQFLSEIGEKHHLLKNPEKDISNTFELQELGKRFEVIPNGTSAFIINFMAPKPDVGYQVMQDFLSHLQALMAKERRTLLLNLHDAIQDQLEALSFGKQGEAANPIFSVRPDLVQRRVEKIQEEIEALKNAYSEKHPRIAALKEQLSQLSQWTKMAGEGQAPPPPRGDIFSGIKVDESSKELFDDLLKKYRYLEVVIYMDQQNKSQYMTFLSEPFIPKSPTSPKLPLLIIWGMAGGFLFGSLRIFIKKIPKVSFSKPLPSSTQSGGIYKADPI